MGNNGRRVGNGEDFFTVHLLTEVERFLKSSKIPAARFGREVMRDPRFVFDLRNGREPRDRTVSRVRAFLEGTL